MEIQIDREFVLHHLPRRPRSAHKGTFGSLLVLAGSQPYRGAALLAVGGAQRAGTGLVRLCSTECVCAAAAVALPCCVSLSAKKTDTGAIDHSSLPAALETPHTAILAGCGITATGETLLWVLGLLKKAHFPLLLDADALNILAGHLEAGVQPKTRETALALLEKAAIPVVLTPHPGEMARLCGKTIEEVTTAPKETAHAFAKAHGCTVVLKGHESVVATPEGELLALRGLANPGLAKAGSGDVLAGVIAGLMAQGFAPGVAAALGLWLHAAAGGKAAAQHGEAGLSPADLPLFLAEVWRDLGR